jgi:AbrB family looped-hinge helix DNA binding protein
MTKKEFVKIVQCDKRGQIVIPKKIRLELGIEDGAAFWIFKVDDEIRLKKIENPKLKK